MRRMYSKKQIESQIESTDIQVSQLKGDSADAGQYLQVGNLGDLTQVTPVNIIGSEVRMGTDADVGKVAVVKKIGTQVALGSTDELVAKTLFQTQPSWSLDIKSLLYSDLVKDGTALYCKFAMYGNVLWLIVSGKFINGSATDTNVNLINNQLITNS